MSELERSGIYQIRNIVTGNRYIGSAKCFRVRWNGHRARLVKGTHHSRHLQNAWDRYGAEYFLFEVLEICEADRLLVREQSWLDLEAPEYNVCRNAGNTLGRCHSDETKKKIAEKASGRKCGPRSEEHRAKLSAVHSGKKKPEHVMRALQEGRSRQAFSDERRAKVSAALTAAYQSGARSREKTEAHR